MVPAGGIIEDNLARILAETEVGIVLLLHILITPQATEFHCSARMQMKSRMVFIVCLSSS